MSWDGFKKALNRTTGAVLVKAADKVTDKEYDIEERRYRVLEKAGEALQKETKGYLDSLRAVTASQVAMGETINNLYEDARNLGGVNIGGMYLQAVTEYDTETVKQLDGPFRETILDPITKFSSYFKEINEAIKKRSHKKQDYEQCKSKVRRLIDKPAKDASKLPRAERELAMAKDIYDNLNNQLKSELPMLIDLRVPYFDPSFESLVKIQLRFCTEGYARLAQVQQYLDPSTRDEYASGQLDVRIDQMLEEMRRLNICSLGIK
ncbi:amphiphysin-like protein [Pichia kluyveri]|uniref:Amphiphysin-like protein n=1 Tax=Pichia kluyveri TaxID=36015 RepID=A0AAV5QZF3_PICKL|nr:amphiphysin-like protein [Pichia kluyveri]